MTPGIHNISADIYHADPAPTASLSSSIAKIMLNQSPYHAFLAHPRLNRAYVAESADSRFDLGSAAHMMLLESREDGIVRVDAADWRTKAAKEAKAAAQAQGKFAILERHYVAVVRMVTVAREFIETTELAGIFQTGAAERTVLWQERDMWFRCRPDLLSSDRRVVLDYKTTECAEPDAFGRQIGRMGYDLQSEFYTRGLFAVTDNEPVFVFLAQEITAPYACSLVSLSNAYREVGRAKVARAQTLWEKCARSNEWPAYTNQICYAEPTSWQLTEAETVNDMEDEE